MVIFFIFVTLLVCILCKEINKRTSIPYASLILIAGIIFSMLPPESFGGRACEAILEMGPEELYYIFIPILIFEQGYNSDLFL